MEPGVIPSKPSKTKPKKRGAKSVAKSAVIDPARAMDGRFAGGNKLPANHAGAATRFGPGNQAAKGHGRPPDRVKRALHDLLDMARGGEFQKDTEEAAKHGMSLTDMAFDTIQQAMLDRDEIGNVTSAGVNAARLVLAYRYGLPKQTTQVNISGQAQISMVRSLLARVVVEDARIAATQGPELTKQLATEAKGKS